MQVRSLDGEHRRQQQGYSRTSGRDSSLSKGDENKTSSGEDTKVKMPGSPFGPSLPGAPLRTSNRETVSLDFMQTLWPFLVRGHPSLCSSSPRGRRRATGLPRTPALSPGRLPSCSPWSVRRCRAPSYLGVFLAVTGPHLSNPLLPFMGWGAHSPSGGHSRRTPSSFLTWALYTFRWARGGAGAGPGGAGRRLLTVHCAVRAPDSEPRGRPSDPPPHERTRRAAAGTGVPSAPSSPGLTCP